VTERPDPRRERASVRRRSWRLIVAVSAGVVALLCVGGIGVGYVLYDRATGPDRGTPSVAVDNYLGALLVDRDDARARLFACEHGRALGPIEDLRTQTEAREHELGTSLSVTWGTLRVEDQSGDQANVFADIRRSGTVDGVLQSVSDTWRLAVVKEDGWRVCRAERLP
jgi:hypothetical protein